MTWYDPFIGLNCERFVETIGDEKWNWVAKRLSGNDTGLTKAHQVGIYLTRDFFEQAFPSLVTRERLNPDTHVQCYFPREGYEAGEVRAIYYNNKYHIGDNGRYGTRDEFRFTRWGGKACPLQNPENTGAIMILAWKDNNKFLCWVAQNPKEEKLIEKLTNHAFEPGDVFLSGDNPFGIPSEKTEIASHVPPEWVETFPTAGQIAELAIRLVPVGTETPDSLLMKRRKTETDIFYEVERLHVEPVLQRRIFNVADFVHYANQVTNRRKSRSGLSLEKHLAQIFREWQLQFEENATTELAKRPDFLFPSEKAYRRAPESGVTLFMLAAKTCCKDRWRQVISEADKIPDKHLFTLQEGVSENQLAEMQDQRIHLVIPEKHRKSFPTDRRDDLLNLAAFISTVAATQ